MNKAAAVCAVVGLLLAALSDVAGEDLEVRGRTLTNVRVSREEPDGVTLMHSSGILKADFEDLPEEWRRKYGYDSEKAAAYRKDMEERRLRQEDARRGVTKEWRARNALAQQRLHVTVEILEVRSDAALAKGTFKSLHVVERERTNTLQVSSLAKPDQDPASQPKVFRWRENVPVDETLGNILLIGLSSPIVGSRWSGTVYPIEGVRDGYRIFTTSLDQAVAAAVGGQGALPPLPRFHPFVAGMGDGLTFPLRATHVQGLKFYPRELRDVRYWCGAVVGGCAYPMVLVLVFGRRKREVRRK